MMLPSRLDLIYYLHIPKTSGTSLYAAFVKAVGVAAAPAPMLWDHLIANPAMITSEARVITGHFSGLFPLWLGRWPRIITMLRSPVARALSHINHVQRAKEHPLYPVANGLSVAEYCRHPELRSSVDNVQSRHLASLGFARALLPDAPGKPAGEPFAWRALEYERTLFSLDQSTGLADAAADAVEWIDAVGICEEHDRSVRRFANLFGWDMSAASGQPSRLNLADQSQRTVDSLSSEDLGSLSSLNLIDQRIYDLAKRRFDDQAGDLE